MEALTLHEAVPGHHLQISLAQELDGLPDWRKYDVYTAFVEGWGALRREPGERDRPLQGPLLQVRPAHLRDVAGRSAWWSTPACTPGAGRASRRSTTSRPTPPRPTTTSRSRSTATSSPGQALAYKIGELKIKELRAYAEQQLGDKFDVRAFHDQVLGHGALPLDVLERGFGVGGGEEDEGVSAR